MPSTVTRADLIKTIGSLVGFRDGELDQINRLTTKQLEIVLDMLWRR